MKSKKVVLDVLNTIKNMETNLYKEDEFDDDAYEQLQDIKLFVVSILSGKVQLTTELSTELLESTVDEALHEEVQQLTAVVSKNNSLVENQQNMFEHQITLIENLAILIKGLSVGQTMVKEDSPLKELNDAAQNIPGGAK